MQKEGNVVWGSNGAHTWSVWRAAQGAWRWEVSGPRGWMATDGAASKGAAFVTVRQTLLRRGESV